MTLTEVIRKDDQRHLYVQSAITSGTNQQLNWSEQSTGNRKARLESRHSQKRLFFHRKISNSLNLNLFALMRYESLKLSTRKPVSNASYLIRD